MRREIVGERVFTDHVCLFSRSRCASLSCNISSSTISLGCLCFSVTRVPGFSSEGVEYPARKYGIKMVCIHGG